MAFSDILTMIDDGVKGLNVGYSHGLPPLLASIPNFQKGQSYVVGGELGSGKTSLADFMFVISPLFDYYTKYKVYFDDGVEPPNKFKLLYCTLEVSETLKMLKFLCYNVYMKKKWIVDIPLLLSYGNNKLPTEVKSEVEGYEYFYDFIKHHIEFIDLSVTVNSLEAKVKNDLKSLGVIKDKKFVWNNRFDFYAVVFDHASLVKGDGEVKTKMDLLSRTLVELRNFYNISYVLIVQFGRSIANAERELQKKTNPDWSAIRPQLSDIKNTNNIGEDAQFVLSIFSVFRYHIPEYLGYNAKAFGDRIRFVDVLKCRDGVPSATLALGYLGEIGHFVPLPPVAHPKYLQVEKHIKDWKKYGGQQQLAS